jgi:hypothetical protein
MDRARVKVRFASAVMVVVGTVCVSVDADAQEDSSATKPVAPAPVELAEEKSPAAASSAVVTGAEPETPSETEALARERARAYATWQYQYGVWQYQYGLWQRQRMVNREPPQRWYGWQTLLVDAAALTLVIAGAIVAGDSRRNEDIGLGMVIGGTIVGLAGAPVVHMAHSKWNNAGVSSGIRLGGALVVLGSAAGCSAERGGCGEGWALLAVVGALAYPIAVIVDAGIAEEDVPPDELARVTVTPWYDARTQGGGLSLGGLF